ncbi:hypothetical protein EI94DRAFT_1734063 [Lactarius quietus]|nr:hypothetical protein EI94DRAFT_1734063 [Lactarius quietus]
MLLTRAVLLCSAFKALDLKAFRFKFTRGGGRMIIFPCILPSVARLCGTVRTQWENVLTASRPIHKVWRCSALKLSTVLELRWS